MEQMFRVQSEEDAQGGALFVLSHGKRVAELHWRAKSGGVIDVHHTFTAPALRGKGVASDLVLRIAAIAAERDQRIIASCWYAEKVLRGSDRYRALLQ